MHNLDSKVKRLGITLGPNPKRVLLRPFSPSLVVKPTDFPGSNQRVVNIFSRVLMLSDREVREKLAEVVGDFDQRHHQKIDDIFLTRYEQIRPLLPTGRKLSRSRSLLIGSYFINEYSLESSALFNPSIVPAPDQDGLNPGELRFILSLRATGEGHISSITFRSGILMSNGEVRIDPVSRFVEQPHAQPAARYDLKTFRRKLLEMEVGFSAIEICTEGLPASFLMEDLIKVVNRVKSEEEDPSVRRAADQARSVAEANYTVTFEPGLDISEKILFPYAQNESNGIEDARFVRFIDDDGDTIYHATYTAYNGNVVLPQLVSTRDFDEFSICTLNGAAVSNKGMALFPRKIGGKYVMLGRQDGENIRLMYSSNLHFWHDSEIILRPSEPWEFVQLGNCGSPIETDKGWLVLTHGVGPMRKYCIGAVLLDRDNPAQVIGRLKEPLLRPIPSEREGYVPNVVYSCGSLIHEDLLIMPYAVSDTASRIASVPITDLLAAME